MASSNPGLPEAFKYTMDAIELEEDTVGAGEFQDAFDEVIAFVSDKMSREDPSHDMHHVLRVVGLARKIFRSEAQHLTPVGKTADLRIVELAA